MGHTYSRELVFTCSSCGQTPIYNSRFRCLYCKDYNLCLKCYFNNDHPDNHVFLEYPTYISPPSKIKFKLKKWFQPKKYQWNQTRKSYIIQMSSNERTRKVQESTKNTIILAVSLAVALTFKDMIVGVASWFASRATAGLSKLEIKQNHCSSL